MTIITVIIKIHQSTNPKMVEKLGMQRQRQEGANLKFAYARNLTLMEKVDLSCQALEWWRMVLASCILFHKQNFRGCSHRNQRVSAYYIIYRFCFYTASLGSRSEFGFRCHFLSASRGLHCDIFRQICRAWRWIPISCQPCLSARNLVVDWSNNGGMKLETVILLMAEILHQLIGSLSHYLRGFIHPRWCKISAINSTTLAFLHQDVFLDLLDA